MSEPTTPPDPYSGFRATLNDARQRLTTVTEQREAAVHTIAECDSEIVNLRRVIVSLAAMVGEPTEMESIGITEACRTVMAAANVPLKLRNVCDQLADVGFDPKTQNNLDASVQAVLNRLADKKEIHKEQVQAPGGKTVIVFIGPKVTKHQRQHTIQQIRTGES